MPIQREFIFANDKAYNIHSTMSYIENLYHNERTITDWRYESIMAQLSNFKFVLDDSQDFIEHPYNGVFTPTDLWLQEFGIEEPVAHWVIDVDDITVGTFDITESSDDDTDEAIASEEEEEMIFGHHIIMEMIREYGEERGLGPDNDGMVTDDWGEGSEQTDETDTE